MNSVRGGASAALALVVAMGCGCSSSASNGGEEADGVVVLGPDGGEMTAPPAPPEPVPGAPPPVGIFVSSSKGVPGADGTMSRPVPTLAEALQLAVAKRMPINVCAETYNESLKLADGITMFGYYNCSDLNDWKRGQTNAKIVAPTSPAVLAEKLTLPAKLAGFDIDAPNAAPAPDGSPAASSIGMIVRDTKNLEITNVWIRAGKGQDGKDGVEPADGNAELSLSAEGDASEAPLKKQCMFVGQLYSCNFDGIIGVRPTSVGGSAGGTSQCKVGPNGGVGGRGGAGRISDNGSYREGYSPAVANGLPAPTTAETTGAVGANGAHGHWSFNESGYVPGDGTPGQNGFPGKGGAGGYGLTNYFRGDLDLVPSEGTWRSGIGAGGGAGGCGGITGTAGKGGGASIALMVVNSEKVSVSKSLIEATEGGRAGKGTLGTLGTPGRAGGSKSAGDLTGAAGARGADGGASGLSGHGAPGAAISLAFKGARPETSEVTFISSRAGAGAPALTRGAQTLPAVTGDAKHEHAF